MRHLGLKAVALSAVFLLGAVVQGVSLDITGAATKATESAVAAAAAAEAAGQREAQLIQEFLEWAEERIVSLEEAVSEIIAMEKEVTRTNAHISEMASDILKGPDGNSKPLAQAALNIAAEKVAMVKLAMVSSQRSLQAAQARVEAIARSITLATYPPPFSEARQQAQTASVLARSVQTEAARAKGAVKAGDVDTAIAALIAALDAESEAWRAAYLAEAALFKLVETIHGWREEIEGYARDIAAAHGQAVVALAEVRVARILLEARISGRPAPPG
jgi:hypothetical protein